MDDAETYLNFRNIPFGNFNFFNNYDTSDIAFGAFGPSAILRTVPLVSSLSISHHQVSFADHLTLYQPEDITDASTPKIPTEDFWVDRFAELKEFKDEYDHCNPSYMQHSQLYSWLHRQKFLFRKGKLPRDRYILLSELGVQFDYHWDEMYQQLKEFREYQMTAEVEIPFDTKLSSWIWGQIYAWRQGKLSRDRIKKLESLGFTHDCEAGLKPPKPQSKKRRQRLLRIQQHQHEEIPLAEIQQEDEAEEEEEEEETEVMSQPPLLPDFELPPPVPQLAEKPTMKASRKSDQNWLTMFEKLKVFKNTQHSLVVPAKHDKKLHLWLRTQRKTWRDGRLAPWKQKKLQQLGIELSNQTKANEEVESHIPEMSFPVNSDDVYKVVH